MRRRRTKRDRRGFWEFVLDVADGVIDAFIWWS
jgi:hypothetical protein